MPDLNTQVVNGQQTPASQPQVGGDNTPSSVDTTFTPASADTTSQVDDGGQGQTLTLEQALRELAKVRKEAADNRVARRQLESEKAERERAQMSKEERLAADLADVERAKNELIQKTQERMLAYETKLVAADLGIIDPEAAIKLIDAARLEYNDDGSPKNLNKLLKELVAAKPYLVASQPSAPRSNVSPTNPASTASQTTTFTLQQIANMSPDDYRKHKAAIFQAQREGRILPN